MYWIKWDEYAQWYEKHSAAATRPKRLPPFCKHCSVVFERSYWINGALYAYFTQECEHGYSVSAHIPPKLLSHAKVGA